jgi:riboflavin synthase
MFTGIIEDTGIVKNIRYDQDNIHFTISSKFTNELYIDQSIAHNGVCLTVVEISGQNYVVTAINETLVKTNLGDLSIGDIVNLERCMMPNQRLDGHFVQGHVDCTTFCTHIQDEAGSWRYTFLLSQKDAHLIVPKGSICINGTSLTVIQDEDQVDSFQVAIIPYTYENTTFKTLKAGDKVNLEYDILGKYVSRYLNLNKLQNN